MAYRERLVFFGNERLSSSLAPSQTPLLRGLIAAGYDIAAVFVAQKQNTSRRARKLEVAEIAKDHKIPIVYVTKLKSMHDEITSYNADAGVLAAFGKIVPQSIIDIFPRGIINVHPSRLPELRGSTPLEQTILSGQTSTAISIMQLDAGMDTGGVFAQQDVTLTGRESKADLTLKLADQGAKLLIENLPAILSGELKPTPQNHDAATYTQQLSKSMGELDFAQSAAHLTREIRAYMDWPGSYTVIANKRIVITQAHISTSEGAPGEHFTTPNKELGIYCGEGALIVQKLKPAGKSVMSAADFINGYL